MNSETFKIHEFSTGIQAEKTSDGGWVSRGFVGEYMNKTIDPIPAAVQSAIANREFAIAEGASSDEPAIVGREMRGDGQDWSVVAVVIRGRDDKGRKPTMYRYFLCEGSSNLWKILVWMESLRKAGKMPIFNPFETKVVGQPNECPIAHQPQISLRVELQKLLINNVPVIVPCGEPCTAFIVDRMATEKARENGQLVAWAFKAEALEKPASFVVIQPASEKAEQLLYRTIASTPQYTSSISGESEIKSAIKGLISRDKVKPDQLQVIETSINQIQDSDWEVIFNAQGAAQARSQGIYSPQMVRLLTLRAIVIPQTLPEFLNWMQKREKQEAHYQVSEVFQSEITGFFTQISGKSSYILSKVNEGVMLLIPLLLDRSELLNPTVWLLSAPYGIWREFYDRLGLAQNIKNDLNLMRFAKQQKHQSTIADDRWKKIFNELKVYWQNPGYPPDDRYLPLAELFSQLDETEIAAFFYQVSLGAVPKKIFGQLDRASWNSPVSACGLRVKKQVGIAEYVLASLIEIGGKHMPFALAMILLVVTFIAGFWSGGALKSSKKPGEPPASLSENSQQSDLPVTPNNKTDRNLPGDTSIPSKALEANSNNVQVEEEYKKGMEETRFKKTLDSIDQIVRDVRKKQQDKSDDEILTAFKKVLEVPDLDYEKAKSADRQQKIKLVKAIYFYQDVNFNQRLGYIDNSTDKTVNGLKADIQRELEYRN